MHQLVAAGRRPRPGGADAVIDALSRFAPLKKTLRFNPGTLGEFFHTAALIWEATEKAVDQNPRIYIMDDMNRWDLLRERPRG